MFLGKMKRDGYSSIENQSANLLKFSVKRNGMLPEGSQTYKNGGAIMFLGSMSSRDGP